MQTQDVRDARVAGYLPGKAVNKEWNQPKRKKCVAVNKAERSWISEEDFDIRHGNAESGACPTGFWSFGFGPVFHHYFPFLMFWNGNVYLVPYMLEVCHLLLDFAGDYS